jgi:hypothetical protein
MRIRITVILLAVVMAGAGDHEKLKGSPRNLQGILAGALYAEQFSATQLR